MTHWTIPRMWPGETVVIIAGGPSLTCRQIRYIARARLQGNCRVIAVNDAAYLTWGIADLVHASDKRWWQENPDVARCPAIKTALMQPVPEGVNVIRYRRQEPVETDPDYVATGRNGGFQAINIALLAGAKRNLLVAYDMKKAKDSHWFGDHEKFETPDTVYVDTWFPAYKSLPESLKAMGAEVINCTPGSKLTMFPTVDLESAL